MAMKFATFVKHLMDFIVQVTDHKYSVAVPRNGLLCDEVQFLPTCPGPVAIIYQAWTIGGLPGMTYSYSNSGWITTDLLNLS